MAIGNEFNRLSLFWISHQNWLQEPKVEAILLQTKIDVCGGGFGMKDRSRCPKDQPPCGKPLHS